MSRYEWKFSTGGDQKKKKKKPIKQNTHVHTIKKINNQEFTFSFIGEASPAASTSNVTTTATPGNTTTPRPNPYANKTVCYIYVGCFDNFPPFDNANLDLPRSPEEVGTAFLLYTRRNWNTSQHLNYTSLTSITNSFYKSTAKTKFIIHGFSNTIKSVWLYDMKNAFLKKVGIPLINWSEDFVLSVKNGCIGNVSASCQVILNPSSCSF
jgi:hypothetical protein